MNNDIFLTRVWDSLGKKMLYPGDSFLFASKERIFYTCDNEYIYTEQEDLSMDKLPDCQLLLIKFANRFTPMLCTGVKDVTEKLIHVGDVLKAYYYKNYEKMKLQCEVYFDKVACGFYVKPYPRKDRLDFLCMPLGQTIFCENNIIGNIYEGGNE